MGNHTFISAFCKEHVTIRLYDASDRKIRTPGNEPKPAGFHHIIWNGQDHAGKKCRQRRVSVCHDRRFICRIKANDDVDMMANEQVGRLAG